MAVGDDWGPAGIGHAGTADLADDWRYVPPAMRPVLVRGVGAALVIVFTAALVLTLGLPSFG